MTKRRIFTVSTLKKLGITEAIMYVHTTKSSNDNSIQAIFPRGSKFSNTSKKKTGNRYLKYILVILQKQLDYSLSISMR